MFLEGSNFSSLFKVRVVTMNLSPEFSIPSLLDIDERSFECNVSNYTNDCGGYDPGIIHTITNTISILILQRGRKRANAVCDD